MPRRPTPPEGERSPQEVEQEYRREVVFTRELREAVLDHAKGLQLLQIAKRDVDAILTESEEDYPPRLVDALCMIARIEQDAGLEPSTIESAKQAVGRVEQSLDQVHAWIKIGELERSFGQNPPQPLANPSPSHGMGILIPLII